MVLNSSGKQDGKRNTCQISVLIVLSRDRNCKIVDIIRVNSEKKHLDANYHTVWRNRSPFISLHTMQS